MIPLITNTVSAAGTFEGIETTGGISGQKIWINTSGWQYTPSREYVFVNFSDDTTTVVDADPVNATYEQLKRARCGTDGKLNVSVNIPYRNAIGEYYINVTGQSSGDNFLIRFNITDIYKVEVVPEVIYWDDTVAQDFTINIYNWTGTSYTLLTESVRYILSDPDWYHLLNDTMNLGTIDMDAMFDWNASDCNYCGEANYTLNITTTEAPYTLLADTWVPVRFHLIDFSPTTATYMDEKTIIGRFIDGGDDYVTGFEYVQVVSPTGGDYYEPVLTSSTGRFSFAVTFNESGLWHVGTWIDGASYRPIDEDTTQGVPYFISYQTIDVGPQTGTITVDPDEEVYGFNVTFEILCEDVDGDPLANAWVYVTGVDCSYMGVGYDNRDYVELGQSNAYGWLNITLADMLRFNESDTAKFLFTYDDEWSVYDADDDLNPLIYAETLVDISSPGAMNVFVNYTGADKVLLGYVPHGLAADPSDPPASGLTDPEDWGNWSSDLLVTVYGKTDSDRMNATVTVTGCGLDLEFDEDDELWDYDDDDVLDSNEAYGNYSFLISPRKGGYLTITVTHGKNSASKDIEIVGLDADVTTSVGDDNKITVEQNESLIFTTNTHYAEVHANLYDDEWNYLGLLNWTVGENEEGNGKDGEYEFMPDVSELGYIVISAMEGYNTSEGEITFYSFDIVEIVPNYDLVITIVEPDVANQTLTAGLEYDIIIEITNLTGYELQYADIFDVWGELLDWENEIIEDSEITFSHDSGNVWMIEDYMPESNGTLQITVTAWDEKHEGNNTDIYVDWALFEYNPIKITAGIGLENVSVEVIAYDALGNIIPEETFEMWNASDFNASGDIWAGNSTGTIYLDENGMATLWLDEVGDYTGYYYAKLNGVNTSGKLYVDYPDFEIDPSIIYVGIVNEVEVIVKDWAGNLLEDVYITFWPSTAGELAGVVPDPAPTDENGYVLVSLEPEATGKMNLSLVRDIEYVDGQLAWTNLLTDTYLIVTTKEPLEITVSQSPIYQGDTLTVTVMSEGDAVEDVNIKFGSLTGKTDANGEVDFTVPDPGVESALYYIKAEKTGYITETIGITVIKKYGITIVTPDEVYAGESFTLTITAKGQPLSGATVTLDGTTTKTSDGEGKVKFTAGAKDETHTITATYEPYTQAQVTIGPLDEKGTPGFELLTLVIAIGVAFILLRRRKHN
jgi:hypothetical protein